MICKLKYYLETNALYHLGKMNESVIQNSFTSAFSIVELVSGVNDNKFTKRKAVATYVKQSQLIVDWRMPEELVFDSFDCTYELDFIENRTESLQRIFHSLIESHNYDSFVKKINNLGSEFNIEYFRTLDTTWTSNFIESTARGNLEIKTILDSGTIEKVALNGIEYLIETKDDFRKFMVEQPEFNEAATILGLANLLMKMVKFEDLSEQEVYESYNGFVVDFVKAFSSYTSKRMIHFESASKNDIMDLLHLLYLRNCENLEIVSDDKIYDYIGFKRVTKSEKITNR